MLLHEKYVYFTILMACIIMSLLSNNCGSLLPKAFLKLALITLKLLRLCWVKHIFMLLHISNDYLASFLASFFESISDAFIDNNEN